MHIKLLWWAIEGKSKIFLGKSDEMNVFLLRKLDKRVLPASFFFTHFTLFPVFSLPVFSLPVNVTAFNFIELWKHSSKHSFRSPVILFPVFVSRLKTGSFFYNQELKDREWNCHRFQFLWVIKTFEYKIYDPRVSSRKYWSLNCGSKNVDIPNIHIRLENF